MSAMPVPPDTSPPDPWVFPTPGPDGFIPDDLARLPRDGYHYELLDGVLLVSRPGGFTVDDLERTPEDSNRYELIDGTLLVSPAPRWEHQHVVLSLAVILRAACPAGLVVFGPTPDVLKGRRGSLQPDLLVAHAVDLTPEEPYLGVPVLAVEVLSPSSLGIDRLAKRQVYARLGVSSYWIVDPSTRTGPAVTVLCLDRALDGYREEPTTGPDEAVTVTEPFPVSFTPADLVRLP
ncbi:MULTISPECIES: Uma2 family endonuclease [Pseudofrankia]|uniref:Uma2 family endonuclease n=1 Tax=Pseudofrankia TaxID=2994363 RepID=UPI000234D1BF|nr:MULTISPECIES: Uma2 family endonuclease [Pseudofrankia]